MKKLFLFLILTLSACSTCNVSKHANVQEIQFGIGGGFTGAVTTYTLRTNGKLLRQSDVISKIPCDSVNLFYELADQLPKEDFVHPGNTYSFVRVILRSDTYYYSWSIEERPDEKVLDLFTKLNKLL